METDGPPQICRTIHDPNTGITVKIFVITVTPQNDIWPHGRIYPVNAVIKNKNHINTAKIITVVFPGDRNW
jgi:hypothetical protein